MHCYYPAADLEKKNQLKKKQKQLKESRFLYSNTYSFIFLRSFSNPNVQIALNNDILIMQF